MALEPGEISVSGRRRADDRCSQKESGFWPGDGDGSQISAEEQEAGRSGLMIVETAWPS